VNHPMGPPTLEICAVADRLALAAPTLAYLGFLLRVLRPGAASRPRSRTPRCVRPRALTGGAVQISGCVGNKNPGCSRRTRGRKIRRDFSDGRKLSAVEHKPRAGQPVRAAANITRGGRSDRTANRQGFSGDENFWRSSLNRVRGSVRAPGRNGGGFSPPGGAVGIVGVFAVPNPTVPPRVRVAEIGNRGGVRQKTEGQPKTPRPLRSRFCRVFKKSAKPNAGEFSGCALA
jgi:hypothetical protein